MSGHTSSIHSLSFSAESTVLVSGSSDATVRVWDVLAPPESDEPLSGGAGGAAKGAVGQAVGRRQSLAATKEKALKQALALGNGEGGQEGAQKGGKFGALGKFGEKDRKER